jgi:hypothetical protein
MDVLSKFASRKFLMALGAIISVLVFGSDAGTPPSSTDLLISAAVAIVYVVSEALVDRSGNTARLAAAVQAGIRLGAEQAATIKASGTVVDTTFTPMPPDTPTKTDAEDAPPPTPPTTREGKA